MAMRNRVYVLFGALCLAVTGAYMSKVSHATDECIVKNSASLSREIMLDTNSLILRFKRGEKSRYTSIGISNVSSSEIVLTGIKTSCCCLRTIASKEIIPAGSKDAFGVYFDSPKTQRRVMGSLFVLTSSKANPIIEIPFTLIPPSPRVNVLPESFSWNRSNIGRKRLVKIVATEGIIEDGIVKGPKDYMSSEIELVDGGCHILFEFLIAPRMEFLPVNIDLKFSDGVVETYSLSVRYDMSVRNFKKGRGLSN